MPRIRSIKPEFFLHTGLAELSPLHRLLFIGLWTQADKKGRIADNSRKIAVTILPYDDCDVDSMLNDLASHREKFITRYEIEDVGKFIQINTFELHQRPHHTEQESLIPPCPNGKRTVKTLKLNGSETGGKGKGKDNGEGKGKGKEYSLEFLSFWESYKKKEDKPYAFSCYQKKIREGVTPEMIQSHVIKYNLKIDGEQTEPQFIKNPSTFLNRTDFKEMPVYEISKKSNKAAPSKFTGINEKNYSEGVKPDGTF